MSAQPAPPRIELLAGIGEFIRATPGARTLAEAAAARGLTLEEAAEQIKWRVASRTVGTAR